MKLLAYLLMHYCWVGIAVLFLCDIFIIIVRAICRDDCPFERMLGAKLSLFVIATWPLQIVGCVIGIKEMNDARKNGREEEYVQWCTETYNETVKMWDPED